MKLWDQVCKTDPDMTERVNFGAFKFTTIDAQYQIKRATEVFGPCGIGWGLRNQKFEMLTVDPTDAHYNLLCFTAELFYTLDGKQGCLEIAADIELFENTKNGWKRVSDPMKKVRTDALTKGLSWLGFSADVFMGKFDDARYVSQLKREQQQTTQPQPPTKTGLETAQDRLKAAAKNVGMESQNLADYLKKYYNTTWKSLDANTANKVASAIENSTVITA